VPMIVKLVGGYHPRHSTFSCTFYSCPQAAGIELSISFAMPMYFLPSSALLNNGTLHRDVFAPTPFFTSPRGPGPRPASSPPREGENRGASPAGRVPGQADRGPGAGRVGRSAFRVRVDLRLCRARARAAPGATLKPICACFMTRGCTSIMVLDFGRVLAATNLT
jgi:hypothetical protein